MHGRTSREAAIHGPYDQTSRPADSPAPASGRDDAAERRASLEEFERLFHEYHGLVFRTAFRITGNVMDAEDVLQTLFLRLMRRESAPDLTRGAQSYFQQAAIHAALDSVRRRRRNVPLDAIAWGAVLDPQPGPDRRRRDGEIRAWLRTALAHLHPRAAEMVVLRFLEGCSYREIARRLGTSQATVAVLLYRARRRLQKELRSFLGGTS